MKIKLKYLLALAISSLALIEFLNLSIMVDNRYISSLFGFYGFYILLLDLMSLSKRLKEKSFRYFFAPPMTFFIINSVIGFGRSNIATSDLMFAGLLITLFSIFIFWLQFKYIIKGL